MPGQKFAKVIGAFADLFSYGQVVRTFGFTQAAFGAFAHIDILFEERETGKQFLENRDGTGIFDK